MTQTVWLTTGLPASGKTTLVRQMVRDSGGTLQRVNLDDLRLMMDLNTGRQRLGPGHEKAVQTAQDGAILGAIDNGLDIAIDNTHLVRRTLPQHYKNLLIGRDVAFRVLDFTHVPVEECVLRDAARPNSVGEKVIRDMAKRLGRTRVTEEWLNDRPYAEPYVPDESLPKAVGFDIDGTLARHVARGPYEFEKIETDAVIVPVARLVRMYWDAGITVLLLSGGQGEYKEHRERWLAKNRELIPYHEFHTRKPGDTTRPDDVVKLEMFNEFVRHRFNFLAMHDDRDRLVSLWRRMNVFCPQVAYGAF